MQIIAKRKVADTARVLMVISITLLVYGIILNLSTIWGLIEAPKKAVTAQSSDTSVISITHATDGKDKVDNSSNREVDGSDIDNGVVREINMLRSEIEREFYVKVLYGKEVEGYTVGGVSTKAITDFTLAKSTLNDLYDTLSLYPKGFFKEIKDGGIPLTIVLVNNYSEIGVTGVTDSSYDSATISIAAIYDFDESFYHESYHYIERYMFKKKANFNSWDSLNPSDFEWNTIDGSLSYSNTFSPTAYFVNNYAQTSGAEDRASTFEYMMAPTKASCLNKNTPIWNKANYMALTIESVLDTVSPNTIEYWERYIRD